MSTASASPPLSLSLPHGHAAVELRWRGPQWRWAQGGEPMEVARRAPPLPEAPSLATGGTDPVVAPMGSAGFSLFLLDFQRQIENRKD